MRQELLLFVGKLLLIFKVKVGEGEVCDAIDVLRVVCCRGGDSWVLVDRRGDRLINFGPIMSDLMR